MHSTPRTWRLGLVAAALLVAIPLVTAATAETANPASNAIDGDAGTDWCTSGWTGTLTIDLGQARKLADLGITLDSASPSASASIELASTAGHWRQVPALRDLALDPGSPMYFPLPDGPTPVTRPFRARGQARTWPSSPPPSRPTPSRSSRRSPTRARPSTWCRSETR